MAYGKVHETFWDDPLLQQLAGQNEDTRWLLLYLITCRHKNRLGCYSLDWSYAAADLAWPRDRVTQAAELLERTDRILYDEAHRVVLVVRFLKHNTMENHKVVQGAIGELGRLPDTPLLDPLLERAKKYRRAHYATLLDSLSNRITNRWPNGIPNHMAYHGTALSVAVALAGNQNHSQNHEPTGVVRDSAEKRDIPIAAAVSRVHASAPAREAAPPEPNDGDSNEVEAAKWDMRTMTEEHGNTLGEPMDQTRFMASAGTLVSGADSSCWRDPRTGSQIAWSERPRLLEIAIAKYVAGERTSLRAALTLAIQQQIDPLPVFMSPVAAGSQAAAVLGSGNELPQSRAPRSGRMERTDGYDRDRVEFEDQQREIAAIDAWVAEHPQRATTLMLQVKAWADTEFSGNPAVGLLVQPEFRKRVRAIIEADSPTQTPEAADAHHSD